MTKFQLWLMDLNSRVQSPALVPKSITLLMAAVSSLTSFRLAADCSGMTVRQFARWFKGEFTPKTSLGHTRFVNKAVDKVKCGGTGQREKKGRINVNTNTGVFQEG